MDLGFGSMGSFGFWDMMFMAFLGLLLSDDLEFDLLVTIIEDSLRLLSLGLSVLLAGSILISVLLVSIVLN